MTASIDGPVRTTDREPVKLWRYYLPNEGPNRSGWAEIVISSGGFFGAVSDYGNYAFAWRSIGCDDARKFFLRAPSEWHYFAGKLGGEHAHRYDGPATEKAVKEAIIEARRDGTLTREEAREEWDLALSFDHLDTSEEFRAWLYEPKKLPEAWNHRQERINPQLEHFCKVTMGRLAEAIRAELEQEARGAA